MRRWQRDGRHANRRGFPGLAPPRCHPGPPSLSSSESSSPARECAQGRGAGRGGQTNPRRPRSLLLLLLPPRPRGRVLQKGVEGEPAGGVAADTEARTAAWRSARLADERRPRVKSQPAAPTSGGGAGGPRSPRGREPGNPRGDRVRSARAGEAGGRSSSPAPPPASPRPAKPPPRLPYTSL